MSHVWLLHMCAHSLLSWGPFKQRCSIASNKRCRAIVTGGDSPISSRIWLECSRTCLRLNCCVVAILSTAIPLLRSKAEGSSRQGSHSVLMRLKLGMGQFPFRIYHSQPHSWV